MMGGLSAQEPRAELTAFPLRLVRLSQKTTTISLCNQLFTYLWTLFLDRTFLGHMPICLLYKWLFEMCVSKCYKNVRKLS